VRPDPHPAHLIIDVGTTRTKLALADAHRIARVGSFPTGDDWEDMFGAAMTGRLAPESVRSIAVASASRDVAERVRTWWTVRIGTPPPIRTVDPATAPLAIDYRPPSALGPDRVADAVAAAHTWGAPVIVVDAGTALTCDLVTSTRGEPRFAGGTIAPGPYAAYRGLIERVPHLGLARGLPDDGDLPSTPASTYDAVRAGIARGAAALVDSLVAGYRARAGDAPVIVTGGFGPLIARHSDTVTAVDPELTLRGILLACRAEPAAQASSFRAVRRGRELRRLGERHDDVW
jgi:type III pantothenate kinase